MILLGSALSYWVSEWCFVILIFVAVNYFQSTFTWGICPPTIMLGKLGWVADDEEEPVILKQRVYLFGRNKPDKHEDQATVASHELKHEEQATVASHELSKPDEQEA
jgi:hypothetical protein